MRTRASRDAPKGRVPVAAHRDDTLADDSHGWSGDFAAFSDDLIQRGDIAAELLGQRRQRWAVPDGREKEPNA